MRPDAGSKWLGDHNAHNRQASDTRETSRPGGRTHFPPLESGFCEATHDLQKLIAETITAYYKKQRRAVVAHRTEFAGTLILKGRINVHHKAMTYFDSFFVDADGRLLVNNQSRGDLDDLGIVLSITGATKQLRSARP